MLLIDAYNVLHVTGVLPPHLAGLEVDGLASLVDSSRHGRGRILIVCDGTGGAAGSSIKRAVRQAARDRGEADDHLRVIYAGPGGEADALIETLLTRYGGKTTTVVSSDRRVLKAARAARARSLTSEKFLQQLAADDAARPGGRVGPGVKPETPLPPRQVRDWARQMGIEADDPLWSIGASAVETPPSRLDAKRTAAPEQQHRAAPEAEAPRPADGDPARGPGGLPSGIDPLILEAMKEWPGRVELDDLDMAKWLAGDVDIPDRDEL